MKRTPPTIHYSQLRYERISPYTKGRVPRIWVKESVYKSFFKDLAKDAIKLLKFIKRLYRKELVVGSILLLALLPEPHQVKAAPVYAPAYIQHIPRLEPAVGLPDTVPAPAPLVEPPAPPAPAVAPGDAKGYALSLVGSSQFACLEPLWNKESGWNPYAVNSIGAMGIPQALGHGQVFALGDWKAQVDWGLNYISATYGTPCSAWAHSQAYNWY